MDDNSEKPKKHACEAGDEIQIGPPIGNGFHKVLRHTADHQHLQGVVRPVREGEMLTGREFYAEPKDPANGVYTIRPLSGDVQAAIPKSKVTTPAYREGWDAIFGKQPVGEA
jgi:hypothetical protein